MPSYVVLPSYLLQKILLGIGMPSYVVLPSHLLQKILLGIGMPSYVVLPSITDANSPTKNKKGAGKTPHLFLARIHPFHMKYPIQFCYVIDQLIEFEQLLRQLHPTLLVC
jgi:hypothetical protein